MRYTRLRRHILDGTLIGTHGTPFLQEKEKKRAKRDGGSEDIKQDSGDDDADGLGVLQTRSGRGIKRRALSDEGENWEEMEAAQEKEQERDEESDEDDIPLAKRRRRSKRMKTRVAIKEEPQIDTQVKSEVIEKSKDLPSQERAVDSILPLLAATTTEPEKRSRSPPVDIPATSPPQKSNSLVRPESPVQKTEHKSPTPVAADVKLPLPVIEAEEGVSNLKSEPLAEPPIDNVQLKTEDEVEEKKFVP